MKAFTDTLSANQKSLIEISKSDKKYRFGHGDEVEAIESVKVPVFFGKKEAFLTIDVVPIHTIVTIKRFTCQRGSRN